MFTFHQANCNPTRANRQKKSSEHMFRLDMATLGREIDCRHGDFMEMYQTPRIKNQWSLSVLPGIWS